MMPFAFVLLVYVAGNGVAGSSAEHAYFATGEACREARSWLLKSGDGRIRAECFPTGAATISHVEE